VRLTEEPGGTVGHDDPDLVTLAIANPSQAFGLTKVQLSISKTSNVPVQVKGFAAARWSATSTSNGAPRKKRPRVIEVCYSSVLRRSLRIVPRWTQKRAAAAPSMTR
jgi:hypothetical protein